MRHALLILLGLLMFNGAVAADPQPMPSKIVDPFFLIPYDPAKVHFEQMPTLVRDRCPELRRRYFRAWVYSHARTDDAEYFILYGQIRVPSEKHPGQFTTPLEDDDGLIVALRGNECLVDQWQFFLRKKINPAKAATPIPASDDDLDAIAADLLRRYQKAFGGKKSFLDRITPEARHELPPVVLKQLEMFEREPGKCGDRRDIPPLSWPDMGISSL
ncbi:MAG TPA: hypothetical protein VMT28_00405 [Terriglobales bacterium]|jgi:hypothetical protein|nr:hypothetical protein [Terriglobales bacterium]